MTVRSLPRSLMRKPDFESGSTVPLDHGFILRNVISSDVMFQVGTGSYGTGSEKYRQYK